MRQGKASFLVASKEINKNLLSTKNMPLINNNIRIRILHTINFLLNSNSDMLTHVRIMSLEQVPNRAETPGNIISK